MLRIFTRVPGLENETVAFKTVFSNISNKVFQKRLQKTDAIAKYVDLIRPCILCGEKTKKICCNKCFKTRRDELEKKLETQQSETESIKRKCIDVCKKCLSKSFCVNFFDLKK